MARLVRLLVYVTTAGVIFTFGAVHAHDIGHYPFTGTSRFSWMIGYVVVLIVAAYAAGIPDVPRTTMGAFWSSSATVTGAALVISVVQLVTGSAELPRFVVFVPLPLLGACYLALTLWSEHLRRLATGADRVLAVVGPQEAATLAADLARGPEHPAVVVATLDPATAATSGAAPDELVALAQRERATVVVLDRQAQAAESLVAQAATLHSAGVRVRTLTLFYDEWLGKLPHTELERVSLMFDIQEVHAQRYARLKRFCDVMVAAVSLVPLALAVPLVALVDLAGNRGPLLFRQERVGMGGRPFTIVKFRTMPDRIGEDEWTQTDDPRLGPVGRWLRRTHIDELPQVVNILRGDLSLVGPRPEQVRYVTELREKIPFYDVRHLVHPGLTGWAQVKFEYGASVEDALEKLQYEFFYLRHQGVALDARILARTVRSVLRSRGR